jgi:hypothetical protein
LAQAAPARPAPMTIIFIALRAGYMPARGLKRLKNHLKTEIQADI